jgi:hypothetical protein
LTKVYVYVEGPSDKAALGSLLAPLDAPLVLGSSHYAEVGKACPQCFQPFVEFLESL